MDRLQLYLYDGIGDWDGPTAKDVASLLLDYRQAAGVDVYINSLGGDVFEGMAIYNLLVRSGLDVATYVDGAALSIASVVAQAGRTRHMARAGLMMVHEPAWWMGYATLEQLEQQAKPLAALRTTIAEVYAARTGQTADAWLARMAAETWFTAEEAVAAGLADVVTDIDTAGRLVAAQVTPSQALNDARALRAAGSACTAADRPPVRVAARLVTPAARPLVVNSAGIPGSKPTSPSAARRASMKLKDLFSKLGLSEDTEIDVADAAAPEAAADDPAPQNAAAAGAPAPEAPTAPAADAPADPAQAINALTAQVTNLAQVVEGLKSERVTTARNAFDALLDQKVKAFAVNTADRAMWAERFEKLGPEVAMQLLGETVDGSRRPGRVQAPQNRSTAGAPAAEAPATMSFKDYFAERQAA